MLKMATDSGPEIEAMTAPPLTCEALLDDGSKCGETMAVTKTDYVYDRKPLVGEPATYTLLETHFHGTCPKCGERKRIENAISRSA